MPADVVLGVAPSQDAEVVHLHQTLIAMQEVLAERLQNSTQAQARRSDAWFLESGDQVRCFFEEEAFAADGSLQAAPARAINKIGHALHDREPVFAAASYDPRLAEIAGQIGMREPLAVQSMAIFKQPGIGGEVGCHQDACFLYTEPMTVTGFWIALEDATLTAPDGGIVLLGGLYNNVQRALQLLLESPRRAALRAALDDWLPRLYEEKLARKVRWGIDVDPVDLY